MIRNIVAGLPLPVYGKGINVRDWLWVEDHASAIHTILSRGLVGDTYNVGGLNEWKTSIWCTLDPRSGRALGREGAFASLITFVKDRAGHDLRYAIDASHLEQTLGGDRASPLNKG